MPSPTLGDGLLGKPDRLSGRHPELQRYEVESRHHLGDRMLDLQPRVHLEEVELAALIEELDGAGTLVSAGLADPDRRLAHRPPCRR